MTELNKMQPCAPNVGIANIYTLKTQKDARAARLYITYCYSIIYICESVCIYGSFDAPVRGFKRIRLFHRGQRHTEPAVIVAFAGVVAEPKR